MPFSRRSFLAAGAGTLLLAACGGGGGSSSGDDGGDGGGATALASRFMDGLFVPGAQRVAVSLANQDGFMSSDVPAALDARVLDDQGAVVVESVRADRHAEGTPLPYYPFALALGAPGVYTLSTKLDGRELTAAFSVMEPSAVAVPKPGDPLPPFDTPTTTDARGLNPICTHQPPCALHEQTLTQALQGGKPVAFLIGTPAFCQTGVCAPILDDLLAAHDRLGGAVTMVHADVYTDMTATTTAPAVEAFSLTFEPCLWVADAKGTIVERLDFVFDGGEIDAALAKAG